MLHISMIMDLAAKTGIWPCLAFLKTQQLVSVRFRVLVTYLVLVFFIFFYTLGGGGDNENDHTSVGAPVNHYNTLWTVTCAKTYLKKTTTAVTHLTSLWGIHTVRRHSASVVAVRDTCVRPERHRFRGGPCALWSDV